MDPEANRREQREIVARIMKAWDTFDEDGDILRAIGVQDVLRLAELSEALDNWHRECS
jgi:hypothetical protein